MAKHITKRAQLVHLISRKSGASIVSIQSKLNWQRRTIRAEISRLRKRGMAISLVPGSKGSIYLATTGEAEHGQ